MTRTYIRTTPQALKKLSENFKSTNPDNMILAILFALLFLVAVVAVAPVPVKALEERASVVVLEENHSTPEVLEEVPSEAQQVLAAARLKLMRRLVRDCRKSEVGTCLPGWSENNPLTGTLNQNARLASIMGLTHLNLPGTKLRGEEYTSMTDLAGELIGASNWAAAQSVQRKLRPAPRKVSMLVPNNAKNVRAHFAVDKGPKVGCNRQSKAQMTGPGEMPLVECDDIVDFGGNTRAFFLSAPIFNQTNATVEPEVVVVAEEGGLDATVEQEVVVAVAEKVEEVEEVQATVEQQVVAVVNATVEQEVVAVVNEFKEVSATVEHEVVAVVVSATSDQVVAAKQGKGCPRWCWYGKTKSMSQFSGSTPHDNGRLGERRHTEKFSSPFLLRSPSLVTVLIFSTAQCTACEDFVAVVIGLQFVKDHLKGK
ncbi:hypothetical protein HKX48_000134 [Thoreauomyces humboldtii]|nr:hypothetical protein HKX48_000134 [Thoreauomyces humboldtii]